jgi:hypothetical protein
MIDWQPEEIAEHEADQAEAELPDYKNNPEFNTAFSSGLATKQSGIRYWTGTNVRRSRLADWIVRLAYWIDKWTN